MTAWSREARVLAAAVTGQTSAPWTRDEVAFQLIRLATQVDAPRGTDAQILKERELTVAAILGAMAFGTQGGEYPPDEAAWLRPFYDLGKADREKDQALELLAGLHCGLTIDGPPMEVADRIFSQVLSDQRALKETIASQEQALDRIRVMNARLRSGHGKA